MKVKMILPALTEAISPYWRPIKYSLFPPLGLATLAGYLDDSDDVSIQDEHVEPLDLDDTPDLVVIQVYITSAYRAYALADYYRRRGAHVCLGGLHVTSLPAEAAAHADTIFLGPGEDTWPAFLADFRAGRPGAIYRSEIRSLAGVPRIRRDLIKRHLYLVPNSIVVSRGCPHVCDFCYKEAFFRGGKSFYTQAVDDALAEIDRLPGRHLYFLDDHLFGNARFAEALFDGMRGMGRMWQAAGTVKSILQPGLLEKAVASGLRSLFVGFETLNPANLRDQHKYQNLNRDYNAAIRRLHALGVMVNGSFVFGMDSDDETVFDRTVEWAIAQGIETATFHILTPYPSTALYQRIAAQNRLLHSRWDLYDTRHVVYQPANISPAALEEGYWRAYHDFYRWGSILKGAWAKDGWPERMRHVAYAGGWKKLEPLWDAIIRAKRATHMLPVLEAVLSGFGTHAPKRIGLYLALPFLFPVPLSGQLVGRWQLQAQIRNGNRMPISGEYEFRSNYDSSKITGNSGTRAGLWIIRAPMESATSAHIGPLTTAVVTTTYQFIDALTHHIFVQIYKQQGTSNADLWPGEGIYEITTTTDQLILRTPDREAGGWIVLECTKIRE